MPDNKPTPNDTIFSVFGALDNLNNRLKDVEGKVPDYTADMLEVYRNIGVHAGIVCAGCTWGCNGTDHVVLGRDKAVCDGAGCSGICLGILVIHRQVLALLDTGLLQALQKSLTAVVQGAVLCKLGDTDLVAFAGCRLSSSCLGSCCFVS